MSQFVNFLTGVGLAAIIAPFAHAVEHSWTGQAGLVAAAVDADDGVETAGALFHVELGADVEHLFENGVTLGAAFGVKAQGDNTGRPAFAGDFLRGELVTDDFVIAPSTGLSMTGQPYDVGPYGALERAYVFVDGGWGEISIGRDVGAASRLDARPPQVMTYATATSPRLDPTGAIITRSQNDVTGPSAKISYVTPRLLGLRLGFSYTPEADTRGVDFNPRASISAASSANLENVIESAASYSRKFRKSGMSLRLGLTGAYAQSDTVDARFDDYLGVGAGIEISKDDWEGGLRCLWSNNAWRTDDGEYEACEVSLLRHVGAWRAGIEAGSASDSLLGLEGSSISFGVVRQLNKHADIGVSYLRSNVDRNYRPSLSQKALDTESQGIFIELSVRN